MSYQFIDQNFSGEILHQIRAYRATSIVYPLVEKANVEYFTAEIAKSLDVAIIRWDFLNACLTGNSLEKPIALLGEGFAEQLKSICDYICHNKKPHVLYLIENVHIVLAEANPVVTEQIRQSLVRIILSIGEVSSFLLLLDDHGYFLPEDLQQIIPEKIYPMPTSEQVASIAKIHGLDGSRLAKVAGGLSAAEIEMGLLLAKSSGKDIYNELLNFKIKRLKSLGLEFLGVPTEMKFGGLDIIRSRVQGIKKDFSAIARKFKVPLPRGWFFVGPPGTGKTHTAKCIASELDLPLVSVGIDAIQSGGVAKFKDLLNRLERIVCIVYFDELDKFFDDSTDSQILGVLLTWMQEKTSDNFLIATLNRLSKIRPEVMRAGRIDDIFWVGFPQNNEKYEIISLYAGIYDPIYQEAFGRMSHEEWITLMNLTPNFTGSELKLLVETAFRQKFHALFEDLTGEEIIEIHFDDFKNALASVKSLYSRDTEGILNIKLQAEKVCTPSSSEDKSIFRVIDCNMYGDECDAA
jgi:ATPase family associated with various cellular activities (AAA)